MTELAVYAPWRRVRLPDWTLDGVVLKSYWIDIDGQAAPPAALVDSARAVTQRTLPGASAAEGDDHGLGFGILHRGEVGVWLLLQWWAHGDICCQRRFLAPRDATRFEARDERPLIACVWELPIIAAERDAWVETMMSDRPTPEAYIAARIGEGWY